MRFVIQLLITVCTSLAGIIQLRSWRRPAARLRETIAAARPRHIAIFTVIVISVSFVSLYVTQFRPVSEKINMAPFTGLGQVLADETAKAVGGKGQIVLLVSDAGDDPNGIERHAVDGFLGQIKRQHQIQIVATETVKIEPPPLEDTARDMGITKAQFEALLKKHQHVDGLVTFIRLPAFTPEEPLKLPRVHPKIIATQTAMQDGKAYLRDKVIVALIASRPEPTANAKPRTPRAWFDRYFQVLTTENYRSSSP